MAKFSDRINKLMTKPKNADKTRDQVLEELVQSTESSNAKLRQEKSVLEMDQQKRNAISIVCSTSGTLSLTSKVKVNGMAMSGKKDLIKSDALAKLSNLLRPVLAASEAMYKSGDVIRNSTLHELDESGKRTKTVLRDADGNELLNADPLSQIKMICHVLETNPETVKALDAIQDALKEYTVENMKAKATTKARIASLKPEVLIERPTRAGKATESTLDL
jgi:hypothetical protein